MMRSRFHPRRLAALLAAGASLTAISVLPAAADAATVGYASGTITYTTAPGEANHVTVAPWGYTLKLTDSGVKGTTTTTPIVLAAGSGCFPLSSTSAACPMTAMKLNADLTDGN